MSPPVARKVFAMRSTMACGGVSLTKRTASFVEMNCAVFGLVASMWRTSSPSFEAVLFDGDAEDLLGAGFVFGFVEQRLDVFDDKGPLAYGPAGEDFSNFGDVALRVAAVDADGVELHDFAGVVFVQPAGRFF